MKQKSNWFEEAVTSLIGFILSAPILIVVFCVVQAAFLLHRSFKLILLFLKKPQANRKSPTAVSSDRGQLVFITPECFKDKPNLAPAKQFKL